MKIGSKVVCNYDYRKVPVPPLLFYIPDGVPYPGPIYTVELIQESDSDKNMIIIMLKEIRIVPTPYGMIMHNLPVNVGFDIKNFTEIDSMEGIDELIEKALDKKPKLQPA